MHRYRWAFVPEVDVNRYSGPETALIEGEQECKPHVIRVLEGIQQRYGVRSYAGWEIQTYSHFHLKIFTLELETILVRFNHSKSSNHSNSTDVYQQHLKETNPVIGSFFLMH